MICPIIWHEHPVGIQAGQELINHGTWQCENISGEWRMFCLGKQSILVQKWQVKSDQTLGANESIWVATSHGWFYSNWPFDMTNTHTHTMNPSFQTNQLNQAASSCWLFNFSRQLQYQGTPSSLQPCPHSSQPWHRPCRQWKKTWDVSNLKKLLIWLDKNLQRHVTAYIYVYVVGMLLSKFGIYTTAI